MKNYFNYFRFLLVAIMLASTAQLYADKTTETEGTSFWFAIPTARTGIGEPTRGSQSGSAEEVYVTSKVDAIVTFYTSSNGFSTPFQEVSVKANEMKIVTLLKHVQDTVGENIEKNKAYYVKSDQPVSLVVYVAWCWTGEAFRIVPEDWLGTEYYTLNLYNDYCKMVDNKNPWGYSNQGAYRDHPGQILIVATEDNTTVTYTPKAETRLVKAGASKTITMQKGNTYLILAKTAKGLRWEDDSDLSGTRIVSDKKIAVFSGHTKGVFPKYNPNYAGTYSGDFIRNMLFDSMWPIELLGKEYVTVPNIYTSQYGGREYEGLHNDERGDMIRFVATKDNTTIWEINASGEEVLKWTRLKRGDVRSINNQETPGHFRANNPVVVGQYGKGWMWWNGSINYKEGENNNKEDEIQNPPKNGQGMLYAVTPTEQWSNYAGFISVESVNNHINVIFKTGDEDKIVYREGSKSTTTPLKLKSPSGIKNIDGSNYSYVSFRVGNGNNSIEALDPSVKFAVYAYGNMDGHKDGFAYGYPTNVNYFTPCEDTIIVETTSNCEIIDGTVSINDLIGDEPCAAIQNVRVDPITVKNATLTRSFKTGDKNGTFRVKFTDKTKDGYIKVTVLSRSGNSLTKEFTYSPELIAADPVAINFDRMQVKVPGEQKVKIKNPSDKVELNIKKLYLKYEAVTKDKIWISDPANTTDIVIPPLGEITVTITALLNTETSISDELWADLACYSQKLTLIKANSGTPIVTIQDVPFGTLSFSQINPANPPKITKLIKNESKTVSAFITGYRMKVDNKVFKLICPELENATPEAPLEIKENGELAFSVTYTPDVADVNHSAILELISSNATTKDFESLWTGTAVDASISITGKNWDTVRVIDEWNKTKNSINEYKGKVTVKNEGTEKLNIFDIKRIKGTYDDGVINKDDYYSDSELPELILDATAVNELKTKGLDGGQSMDIPVTFIPKAQEKYFCGLKAVGEIASTHAVKESPVSDETNLKGIGKQPHVSTIDVDFGILNLNNVDTQDSVIMVPIIATSITDKAHDMEMTVVDLTIGKFGNPQHAGFFNIEKSFDKKNELPRVLQVGDTLWVPVIFTPPTAAEAIKGQTFTAQLEITCDAPDTESDIKIAHLKGQAVYSDVDVTPYHFETTYIQTERKGGMVTFVNKSSVNIYLVKSLFNSKKDFDDGNNKAVFNLTEENYIVVNDGVNPPDTTKNLASMEAGYVIPPSGTLYVPITFTPREVLSQDYKGTIDFTYVVEDPKSTEILTKSTEITGRGKKYLVVASIPKGYEAKPGEFIHLKNQKAEDGYATFILKPSNDENKELSDARINKFTATFQFADDELDINKGIWHVYPLLKDGTVEIITENTMTAGWQVSDIKILNNKTLSVYFKNENGEVLSSGSANGDVLFKFRMLGYLSSPKDLIELKPNFIPEFPFNQYVFADSSNGDVKINKVCIDDDRVVISKNLTPKAGVVKPLPVVNNSVLDYTVAIDCPVLMEVFNSNGVKVATLINNEMKKAGNYQLNINPEILGLSNGTYTYRIEMGGYSTTNSFVIQR